MSPLNRLSQAEAILRHDPVRNAYPLLRIAQEKIADCTVIGNSVRLRDGENDKTMYCVDSSEEFCALYQTREESSSNVSLVTDDRFVREIPRLDSMLQLNAFYQLLAPEQLPVEPVQDIAFTGIGEAYIDWILSVYQHPELNPAFIMRRASAPNAIALFEGRPVGFFMSHCDAELGPAYVAPEFRGSGLATQLLSRVAAGFLMRGTRPVLYVHPENTRSLRWLLKSGCTLCPQKAVWFWREVSAYTNGEH